MQHPNDVQRRTELLQRLLPWLHNPSRLRGLINDQSWEELFWIGIEHHAIWSIVVGDILGGLEDVDRVESSQQSYFLYSLIFLDRPVCAPNSFPAIDIFVNGGVGFDGVVKFLTTATGYRQVESIKPDTKLVREAIRLRICAELKDEGPEIVVHRCKGLPETTILRSKTTATMLWLSGSDIFVAYPRLTFATKAVISHARITFDELASCERLREYRQLPALYGIKLTSYHEDGQMSCGNDETCPSVVRTTTDSRSFFTDYAMRTPKGGCPMPPPKFGVSWCLGSMDCDTTIKGAPFFVMPFDNETDSRTDNDIPPTLTSTLHMPVADLSQGQKRKRSNSSTRRISVGLRFLDIEAAVSDVDEESDDDGHSTDEISEDDDIEDDPALYVDIKTPPQQSDDDLRSIAARYEERARKERRADMEDADELAPSLFRAADVNAKPLYVFTVPPREAVRFLSFLFKIDSAEAAFSRSLASNTVYVETGIITELLKDLKAYEGKWKLSPSPRVLDVLDSIDSFQLGPEDEHVGRYRRLRHRGSNLEPGDIVFVTSPQSFLAIPRVAYGSDTKPSPQALFDKSRFVEHSGSLHIVQRNNLVVVDKGRLTYTVNGLQRVSWTDKRRRPMYKAGSVVPTDAELALFTAAKDTAMQRAPNLDPSCALQNGDRVVAVAGDNDGRTGRIVVVWSEMKQTTSGERKAVRYCVVQDESAASFQSESPGRSIKPAECFVSRIADVRPHIFSIPRPILVGDRVRVVDGETLLGRTAFVENLFAERVLEVRMTDTNEEFVLDLADVQVDFEVGEVVRLVRGQSAGAVGMIVSIVGDGNALFFPCDYARIRRILSSRSKLLEPLDEDISISVPLRDLRPHRDDWSTSMPKHLRDACQKIHTEWLEEMHTGKGYQGIEVMLCGRHQRKGAFGTVVGYTNLKASQTSPTFIEYWTNKRGKLSSAFRPDSSVVSLTIQFEGGSELTTTTMDHTVERHSQRPLWEYKLAKEFAGLSDVASKPLSQSVSTSSAALPAATHDIPVASIAADEVEGETSGDWLTRPEFVKKRLDVKIAGVRNTRWPKYASHRTRAHEGDSGYLHPFDKSLQAGSFSRGGLKIKIDGRTFSVGVPADTIRPCRTLPDLSRIDTAKCRVIVIGPDFSGSKAHIGQYAETMPGSALAPLVCVRFPQGYSRADATFPLGSLCRAINVRIEEDGIVADSTTFS
ncbi:hypothetical protein B0H12DRAFT_1246509 [Mycena haematopus]|nr:hypothetical protein B0H12DRAFT_1246509 [Mycena haematopus]